MPLLFLNIQWEQWEQYGISPPTLSTFATCMFSSISVFQGLGHCSWSLSYLSLPDDPLPPFFFFFTNFAVFSRKPFKSDNKIICIKLSIEPTSEDERWRWTVDVRQDKSIIHSNTVLVHKLYHAHSPFFDTSLSHGLTNLYYLHICKSMYNALW